VRACERLGFALLLFLGHILPILAQTHTNKPNAIDVGATIPGVWRGHSVCEDKNSPCHDEVNVYRLSRIAGRPDTFTVTASKIVEGREIVMGSGEWKYDAGKQAVECKTPAIRLSISGDQMEGALSVADGTVYRRIYLKKESSVPAAPR
jgi:hypothetical protein